MANEIPASDEELDALMAELEESTGVSAVATKPPAPKAPATPTPPTADEVSDEELDGLELDDEPAAPAPVAPVPTPEATDEGSVVMEDESGSTFVLPASLSAPADTSVDDDLAALEAEIASGTVAPPETPPWEEEKAVDTLGQVHTPDPVDLTVPTPPAGKREEGMKVAPKPAPTPISAEEEEALAEAVKKKAKASLDFYIDVDDFKREMQVTETNLDNCMMSQAALRAYHGAMAARAEAQAASIKARFEVKEAQLYANHRKAFVEAGEKATEKAIENAVKLDPKWIALKVMVIEAESIAAVAKACVGALADRRDMVIQLGADRREDSKGQVRTMARDMERESLRDRATSAARVANG
jgi:hypothetical protein